MRIGAHYLGNGHCEFIAWAPLLKEVKLKIVSPLERLVPLSRDKRGYWKTRVEDVPPGTRYFYQLEGERDRPDPASYFQSEGVHGPSQVVDHYSFHWDDDTWKGLDLSKMIIYELHVGAFTPEGTFAAVIPRLNELKDIGVNTIEIMPVAQFPGDRNWGYDGVYPFAVQDSYGGPDGLKKLVNACHKRGMAVVLDVVYNHLGPEGNYLWDYGPYFTDRYNTPWGQAINFDGAYSDEVKNYFIENALYWFQVYHIDALRLDAIHGIFDMSARPFLQGLAERIEEFSNQEKRRFYLIAESDLNDAKVIRSREMGGYGIDAQWCDDFHHALRVLLTGENQGYYVDFGRIEHLVKSIREGFIYSGQYSGYRRRSHGNSAKERPANQFVVFAQNHDQVGNRMLGERLSTLVSFEALKLAAGAVFLSPYIPLLFMGEEYGEDAPFLYFVSHSDPELIEAVREGRKQEFNAFSWQGEPPDPQGEKTFLKSKINWKKRDKGEYKVLLAFYRRLIKLREEVPALSTLNKDTLDAWGLEDKKVIFMRRWQDEEESQVFCILNFNKKDITLPVPLSEGRWQKVLDSSDRIWHGPGALLPEALVSGDEVTPRAESLVVYVKEKTR